jgi:amino-acid N-acetyltransferase
MMIKVRAARKEDVPEVSRLIRLGAKEGALLLREKKEISGLARKGNIMAAFDDDKIVGVVALDFYSRRLAELRSLYVSRAYRNRGVGKRLVDLLVRRAKTLGVEELLTITIKEKAGWFAEQGFSEAAHGFKAALFRRP